MPVLLSRLIRITGMLMVSSCVLAMVLFFTSQPSHAAQVCGDQQKIAIGKYYLLSNLWGAKSGEGQQCIWDISNNGSSISWATSWNWGGAVTVKSYNSVVLGWHFHKQTTNFLTGLPLQLSSNQPVKTNWTYNIVQKGQNPVFNVAYDLWVHTIPNPTADPPSDEVMIWLNKQGSITPVGSTVAVVNLDGTIWTLWEGRSSSGWQVHTFVRSVNTTGAQSLNLSDFLNYLVSNKGLSSAKYLTGVEAGSEVWLGNAEMDSSSYSTDVGSVVGVSPLPTATPTPIPSPTPTSLPTPIPTALVETPTPVPTSEPASTTTGTKCFAVFFFIGMTITIGKLVTIYRRSRIIRTGIDHLWRAKKRKL